MCSIFSIFPQLYENMREIKGENIKKVAYDTMKFDTVC